MHTLIFFFYSSHTPAYQRTKRSQFFFSHVFNISGWFFYVTGTKKTPQEPQVHAHCAGDRNCVAISGPLPPHPAGQKFPDIDHLSSDNEFWLPSVILSHRRTVTWSSICPPPPLVYMSLSVIISSARLKDPRGYSPSCWIPVTKHSIRSKFYIYQVFRFQRPFYPFRRFRRVFLFFCFENAHTCHRSVRDSEECTKRNTCKKDYVDLYELVYVAPERIPSE